VLPVEVTLLVRGVVVHRTTFSNLRMVSSVPLDTFQVPSPAPVNPIPFDHGFRRSSLAEAGLLAGYPAVTPGWLPEGYELSTVAVAAGTPAGLQASGGGDNPPNQDVISISYRRGLDQITVTSRRATGAGTSWKDPFSSATMAGTRVQNVRLDGGRFLGTIVEQVTTPGTVAHLWGRTPDLVFTVAGDVEPSQLLRTANGLR
jgi:hypothetical protein